MRITALLVATALIAVVRTANNEPKMSSLGGNWIEDAASTKAGPPGSHEDLWQESSEPQMSPPTNGKELQEEIWQEMKSSTNQEKASSSEHERHWACPAGTSCTFMVELTTAASSSVESTQGKREHSSSPTVSFTIQLHNLASLHDSTASLRMDVLNVHDAKTKYQQHDGQAFEQKLPQRHVQEEEALLEKMQRYPVFFEQQQGGSLVAMKYNPGEQAQMKQLKQAICGCFELDIQTAEQPTHRYQRVFDGPDAPSVASYLVEKSGNGLISYQVEHNYDHPTLRKLTSSKTLASSFLQRDHSKLQVLRSKNTEAKLRNGTLQTLHGNISLQLGKGETDSRIKATAATQFVQIDQVERKPVDQISTIPKDHSHGSSFVVNIRLLNSGKSDQLELTEMSTQHMAAATALAWFDGRESLAGWSNDDVIEAVNGAMQKWEKATGHAKSHAAVALMQILIHDARAPALALAKATQPAQLVDVLRHSAISCIAAGSCVAAQEQLMELHTNAKCDEPCKDRALDSLEVVQHAGLNKNDISTNLSSFLNKHGRVQPSKPADADVTEAAQLAAGSTLCAGDESKTFSYPTGADEDSNFLVQLKTGITWDCAASSGTQADGSSELTVSAYGHSATIAKVEATNHAAVTTGNKANKATSVVTFSTDPRLGWGQKKWNLNGNPESGNAGRTNPKSARGPAAKNTEKSENKWLPIANYVFINPIGSDGKSTCGELQSPQELLSYSAEFPALTLAAFYGVVKLTGSVNLGGRLGAEAGVEVDFCSAMLDSGADQTSNLAAYAVGGASASGAVTVGIKISTGIPMVATATATGTINILEGSLQASGTVAVQSKGGQTGRASVTFNAAAGSGTIDLNLSLFNGAFSADFPLYEWQGRKLDRQILSEVHLETMEDVAPAPNFAFGDLDDWLSCCGGQSTGKTLDQCKTSANAAELCKSGVCAQAPKNTDGSCSFERSMSQNLANCEDMVYRCRPAKGFRKGVSCAKWTQKNTLGDDCEAKAYCKVSQSGSSGWKGKSVCSALESQGADLDSSYCKSGNSFACKSSKCQQSMSGTFCS